MANDRPRQHAWRTAGAQPATSEPGKTRRGLGKRFAVLAVTLIIVGVIAGILAWGRSKAQPIFLGIPITQYEDRAYPPNAWAQRDGEALRDHFGSDSALATQAQEKKSVLDQIATLTERTGEAKDKGRPVVVYVNAHAVAGSGKVQLLPGRASPDSPASWLPLDDVLSALRLGKGQHLLLLDLAHPIADAHAGILTNDLADLVHDELKKLDDAGNLPFFVLTSCGKGQISHVSLELQRSVFAFFLEQGMAGYADGWNDKKQTNGQVWALELANYATAQVAVWADQHRLAPQVPQLYGKGKDFLLISPKTPYPEMKLPDPFGDYPKWLTDAWVERDKWRNEKFRRVPRTFRELEVVLLRAERRWLAGEPEPKLKSEFDDKVRDLNKQEQENQIKEPPPQSLAQARRQNLPEDPAVVKRVAALLQKIHMGIPFQPDDFKPFQEKPLEPGQLPVVAHYTLESLLKFSDPTPEQIKEFDGFLKKFSPPRYVELEALAFLVAIDLDPKFREKWSNLVALRRFVLDSTRLAELAAAIDPRALAWLKSELNEADQLRREGLLQVATGGMDDRPAGFKKLEDASTSYKGIITTADNLKSGFRLLEEVHALLPALVGPLDSRAPFSVDDQLWSGLVASTATLQRLLTPPKTPGKVSLEELPAATARLQGELGRAREPYKSSELDRLLRRAGQPNGLTADDVRRLLESPLWSGPDRIIIYNKARELGQTVSGAAIEHAAKLAPGAALPPAEERFPDLPARRAKMAIDLLRLDGFTKVDPLNEALANARKSNNPEAWRTLGPVIRKAWAVALPKRYEDSADLAERELTGFVIHPFDIGSVKGTDQPFPGEPAAELRRRQSREFWEWLALQHYRKDAEMWGAKKEPAALGFYAKALMEASTAVASAP